MTVMEQPAGPGGAIEPGPTGARDTDHLEMNVGSNDDLVIVALSGDLTASTVPVLETLANRLVTTGQCHVMLDCRRLYTVDGPGLAGLHDAWTALERHGGSLTVTGARPHVRATLDHYGLAEQFGLRAHGGLCPR